MKLPNFTFEKRFWKRGFKYIGGIDEVGRGSFAGPVVAGCVVFKRGIKIPKEIEINDSKKLTSPKRKRSNVWIRENALTWGTGEVSVKVIDRVGISRATQMAFRRAIENANKRLQRRIEYLLIDAFFVPYVRGLPMRRKKARKDRNLKDERARQLAIKNGDQKSLSIAAASIVAKEYRDNIMKSLGKKPRYKRYLWEKNKGYGTKQHGKAIKKYGVSKYHRKKFIETFLSSKKRKATGKGG